jgi:hypothetical protein
MNTLRGEFSFTLNKKKYQACLSLNAMRLMCNAMGVKLNDMDKWLSDDPLTAIPAFAYYGVKNQAARKGKESGLPDFEHFCALALDDSETLDTMMQAVTEALGAGEDTSGN